jgi:Fic family protein
VARRGGGHAGNGVRGPSPAGRYPSLNDGNGRTARLLMNLVLIRGGYPPVAIRLEDRLSYLHALQRAQSGQGDGTFTQLLYSRLDTTLDEYLNASREALPPS